MLSKLFILVFLLACHQVAITHQSEAYSISFDDSTLNILVGELKDLALHLRPDLKPNDPNVEVKFGCQDADDDARLNWTSTDPKCTILEVTSGYDYEFSPRNASTVDLTIKGLKPGKIQLVGNANDSNVK